MDVVNAYDERKSTLPSHNSSKARSKIEYQGYSFPVWKIGLLKLNLFNKKDKLKIQAYQRLMLLLPTRRGNINLTFIYRFRTNIGKKIC